MSMTHAINIDNTSKPGTVDAIAANIALIFQAGYETRQTEETVQVALQVLGDAAKGAAANLTVQNCVFDAGEKTANFEKQPAG